jgi:hypothetical protein
MSTSAKNEGPRTKNEEHGCVSVWGDGRRTKNEGRRSTVDEHTHITHSVNCAARLVQSHVFMYISAWHNALHPTCGPGLLFLGKIEVSERET